MRRLLLWTVFTAAFIAGPALASAAPADAPTATFGLEGQNSTILNIAPTHNAGETFYKYTFSIPQNTSLNDTIAVDVCLDAASNGDSPTWSDEVAADDPAGAFAAYVSVATSPWSFNQSSAVGGCQTATITISIPSSATAIAGGFNTNVHFKTQNGQPDSGQLKLKDGWDSEKSIKIFVNVTEQQLLLTEIYCYLTDSEGNFLLDCDGSPVNASADIVSGRFAIVANKGKKVVEVATNPGQFYYNLLWINNSGTDQTVNVSMPKSGLTPQGAQAVHWLTFSTNPDATPTTSLTGFSDVIEGNPAGSTGSISTVVVKDGDTLYVTYHLEYGGLGAAVPAGCAGTCVPANQKISITGTVSGGFGSQSCTNSAWGYLKQ